MLHWHLKSFFSIRWIPKPFPWWASRKKGEILHLRLTLLHLQHNHDRGEYFPLFCNFCYGIVFWNSKLSEQFFKIPSYQDFSYKSNPKYKLFQSKKIFFGKYKLFHYFHEIIIRPSSLKGLHNTEQKFCNYKLLKGLCMEI